MRLAIIQNLYTNYIVNFQETNSNELTSYANCLNLLQQDAFSWNGVWGRELAQYDFEVFELYINYDRLNYHWCAENGFKYNDLSIEDILFEQLKAYRIDVVFNTEVKLLKTHFIKRIKEISGVSAILAHVCSPYFSQFDLLEYDGIFTCVHHFVNLFKSYGMTAFYLPHCFNPQIIKKIRPDKIAPKINSVLFAGGVIKGQDLHDDREQLLLAFLNNNVPLSFFSDLFYYNHTKSYGMSIAKRGIYHFIKILRHLKINEESINKIPIIKEGLSWKYLPGKTVDKRLIKAAQKPLYGLDFFSKMQNYSVSLNIHAGAAKDEAANLRLFEASGVGSALITDYKSNLSDFFDIDNEVVAYKSFPEAVEKAKYLLDNPAIAVKIGKAGQQRTLKDHTFHNRAPIIAEGIFKVL